jgi:hypothetical protein
MSLPDVPATKLADHYSGDLSDFTTGFIAARLNEVVDKIEARSWGPLVAARLESGVLKQRLYEAVICRLATRVFRNPDGFRSETEGGYSYNLSAAVASGTIWFTDDDYEDLTGINPKASGVIGTANVAQQRPGWVR